MSASCAWPGRAACRAARRNRRRSSIAASCICSRPAPRIQAVDATNGDLLWEYARRYPEGVRGTAAREKSIGIYQDMIYFAAPDGFLVAIDAKTGQQRWEFKLDNGGQQAGGILVADGKVITNRTCEQSKRENCFIAANDAMTGRLLWKFFTTAAPGEPGGDTWGDMPVEQRAAGPWGHVGSYDPVRKVLYWGIANPNPYTRLTRHGGPEGVSRSAPANLYSNSTVAIDINTGKLNWYYQELPGDDWDADHNHERVLIRTRVSPDPQAREVDQSRHPARARSATSCSPPRKAAACGRSISRPASSCGRGRSPTTIPTTT